eukprot:CAMPEP_0115490192 /NCGR_PEP_ID=MMETSP0271-20121206/62422_1 /TAXON_ID=71861 /ORGANISM="Scrippsiella trochoidea, Strain CCMP3099" /LENGTH=151 /DNA_ID=CAMNT_0002918421 /DNA_START=37 /DNA_END=488 /DNA_ORIENTATION=+
MAPRWASEVKRVCVAVSSKCCTCKLPATIELPSYVHFRRYNVVAGLVNMQHGLGVVPALLNTQGGERIMCVHEKFRSLLPACSGMWCHGLSACQPLPRCTSVSAVSECRPHGSSWADLVLGSKSPKRVTTSSWPCMEAQSVGVRPALSVTS